MSVFKITERKIPFMRNFDLTIILPGALLAVGVSVVVDVVVGDVYRDAP
jgi:energy-converting hydrogenase Eha subunit A